MISVVLPVLNEPYGVLENFINSMIRVLKEFEKFEIILIDDKSSDEYQNLYKVLENKYKNLRLISHREHAGQIAAIKTGLKNSTGEYIICIDADGEYKAEAIKDMVLLLLKGENFVCGVRKSRKHYSLFKKFISSFVNWLFNFLNPQYCIKDFLCPVNGIRKSAIKEIDLNAFRYSIFKLDLLLHIRDIANVEINYCKNKDVKSNYNLFRGGILFFNALYEILHFSISSRNNQL